MKEAVAILCAGGPAPGINTVISSVTKIFINNGYNVLGINGGYKSLFADEPAFEYLDFEYVVKKMKTGNQKNGHFYIHETDYNGNQQC